ncbi:MAG: hypothetical protein MJ107_02040 [Lachnospiraceae bacterium]|nr:hypothetical protein [Lachnospiraceae bacterium]
MKNTETIICRLICGFFVLAGAILSYYSLIETVVITTNYEEYTILKDHPLRNLITIIILFALLGLFTFIIDGLISKRSIDLAKFEKYLFTAVFAVTSILSIIWAFQSDAFPRADGWYVAQYAEVTAKGIYPDFLLPQGYLYTYQNQLGLYILMTLLFKLFGSMKFLSFTLFNALSYILLFASSRGVVSAQDKRIVPKIYVDIFYPLFLPAFLYVGFIYQDISALAFGMFGLWMICEYFESPRLKYVVLSFVGFLISAFIRNNLTIILIALAIYVLVTSLRQKKFAPVLGFLAVFLAVFIGSSLPKWYLNSKFDAGLNGKVAYSTWIYMGLGDNEFGPGTYDGTNRQIIEDSEFDLDVASKKGNTMIKERVSEMTKEPLNTLDFFKRKLLIQWNEPDCHAYYEVATAVYDPVSGIDKSKVNTIAYVFKNPTTIRYSRSLMNIFQLFTYVVLTIWAASYLFSKRATLRHLFLLMIADGGIVLTLLWEAKSRYVLPYMLILVCCLAIASADINEWIKSKIKTKLQ